VTLRRPAMAGRLVGQADPEPEAAATTDSAWRSVVPVRYGDIPRGLEGSIALHG